MPSPPCLLKTGFNVTGLKSAIILTDFNTFNAFNAFGGKQILHYLASAPIAAYSRTSSGNRQSAHTALEWLQ
jgi:hypothetical protein